MAITFTERRKKLRYLFLVLVIIIFITIIVIWQGFFAKAKLPPLLPPVEIPTKKLEINFEVFKSPLLEKLQPLEEIPALEEKVGREDPFIAY